MLKYAELSIQCADYHKAQSIKEIIADYCFKTDNNGFSLISCDKDWLYVRGESSLEYPVVRLALYVSNENRLVLANIVPDNQSDGGLNKHQYNAALDSFYRKVIVPVCGTNYTVIKPDPNVQISTLIPNSYRELLYWESGVNRRAPFSHPLDLNRWFSFVYCVASNREEFSSGDFQLWLQDDREWSGRDAFEAALRYENDRLLANYFVAHRI